MFSLFKKRKETLPSKWQIAIDKLHSLDTRSLVYVHSSDLGNILLKLSYSNVIAFRASLQKAVFALSANNPVFRDDFKKDIVSVKISNFFTDDQGNYVDEFHEGELLVDTVSTFLKLFEGVANENSIEGGTKSYNFRILSEIANQTVGLIDILLEITNRYNTR